jgi:hypothetical protein
VPSCAQSTDGDERPCPRSNYGDIVPGVFQPVLAKYSKNFSLQRARPARAGRLNRIILRDQWMLLAAGVDFESRLLLSALLRFLLSIASASNGNRKPARSRFWIALRSREE